MGATGEFVSKEKAKEAVEEIREELKSVLGYVEEGTEGLDQDDLLAYARCDLLDEVSSTQFFITEYATFEEVDANEELEGSLDESLFEESKNEGSLEPEGDEETAERKGFIDALIGLYLELDENVVGAAGCFNGEEEDAAQLIDEVKGVLRSTLDGLDKRFESVMK